MSSSVDSRILGMKFDNKQFEKGASATLSTIQKLKQSLNFLPETKALNALQTAGSKFSLKGMGSGVDGISAKFLALSTVGVTALATLTHKAVTAGAAFAKSFTIQPILDGLHEYEQNLKSTQTIAANTGLEGAKGLAKVNATLDEMNEFSDQTIYNFSEMARNLGTFTAAGVDLKTAASAIKGIANLAALSGSSSEQASTAMYQLSQAIAAGKVGLQDWNSVVNAGMGGKKFQNALVQTAIAMGDLEKSSVKLVGPMKTLKIDGASFRDSISAAPGQTAWLTSDILVNTLATLDGRFSKTALAIQGYEGAALEAKLAQARLNLEQKSGVKYTDKQFRELLKMSDAAFRSATEVKTLGQVFDVAKEAMGSGWAATWRIIFGDLNEAKKTFTSVSGTVNGFINDMSAARNSLLRDWKEMGGRTVLIEGIGNVFKALGAIIKPIGQAFRDVFPPATGKALYNATVAFRDFTESLIISKDTAEGIRGVFKVVFSVLEVGLAIIGGLFRYFLDLALIVGELVAPVLRLVGAFANLFAELFGAGDLAGLITKVFDAIIAGRRQALEPVIAVITKILDTITELVYSGTELLIESLEKLEPYTTAMWDRFGSGVDWVKQKVSDLVGTIGGLLGGLGGIGDKIGGVFDGLDGGAAKDGAKAAAGGAQNVAAAVSSASSVGGKVMAVWGAVMDFMGRALSAIGRELKEFGGFLMDAARAVGDFVSSVFTGVGDAAGGVAGFASDLFRGIGTVLSSLFGWLKGFFDEFLADLDFQDALALINTGTFIAFYTMLRGFFKSVSGMVDEIGGSFENLGGMFKQVTGNLKTMQTDVRSNILMKIAGALLLLAAALFILSKIPAERLKLSLGAVTALMIELVAALAILEKTTTVFGAAQMTILSAALVGLGLAMLGLAGAVAIFGTMDPDTLKQGLGVVTGVIVGLVGAAALLSKTGGALSLIGAAIALGILSASLVALSGAIKLYSSIDMDTIVNGAVKIIGVVAGLGLAMSAIPPTAVSGAAALVVVAVALRILSKVITDLAGMSIGDTIQMLIALGGALLIVSVATNSMTGALAGAAAMLVVAVAVGMLAKSLALLGSMSLWEIIKGLVALAAVLVVIGVAGTVLSLTAPFVAVFGAALLILGAGLFLAGAGMALFATALAGLAVSGAAGFAVLTAGVIAFAELFPLIMQQIGLGIVAFANVIEQSAPKLGDAISAVLKALLKVIEDTAPQMGDTIVALIKEGLKATRRTFPDFVRTGAQLITNMLNGIDRNIVPWTNKAVSIVTKFINTLSSKTNIDKFIDAGADFIVNLGKGVASKIKSTADDLYEKAKDIGSDIIAGVKKGISNGVGDLLETVGNMGQAALNKLGGILKIKSPSRAFAALARWIPAGVAKGIMDNLGVVDGAMEAVANTATSSLKLNTRGMEEILLGDLNISPTITPVLDLTRMQNEASRIDGLLSVQPIDAVASLRDAQALSDAVAEAQEGKDDGPDDGVGGDVNFYQYNTSPKELSTGQLYRNTQSQISLAKEALKK